MPKPPPSPTHSSANDSPAWHYFASGLACADAGDWAGAARAFGAAIQQEPHRSGPWRNRAYALAELGRFEEALADARQLLTLLPEDASAHALLGRLLLETGEIESAARAFGRAHALSRDDEAFATQALDALLLVPGRETDAVNMALSLAAESRLTQAQARNVLKVVSLGENGAGGVEQLWQGLLAVTNPPVWAWEGYAGHLVALGRLEEATVHALAWSQSQPGSASASEFLASLLTARGDLAASVPLLLQLLRTGESAKQVAHMSLLVRALASTSKHLGAAGALCNTLVQQHPQDARAWALRGSLMLQLFESSAAESDLRRALALSPDDVSSVCNLAQALAQQGRDDEGLRLLEERWRPNAAPPLEVVNARAGLLRRQGRLQEAEAALRAGLARGPHPALAVNLAYVLLLQDRYEEGLPLLADRSFTGQPQQAFLEALQRGMQRWQGEVEVLRGRRLVIVSQNGIGDTIQFARHVPWLIAQGAKVVLQAPARTGELLRSLHPALEVFEAGQPMPPGDLVADVYSLPALLRLTRHTIDAFGAAHCLTADPQRVEHMRLRLGPPRGLRVALCWRGTRSNLSQRSVPLAELAALDLPGVEWFSLQHGVLDADEVEPARRMGMLHEGWSFADAAAAMTLMDVVVSVDTVHCHIAGSLGLRTLVPLSAVPDWRWGVQGSTTPWYPTMTLLRQTHEGRWQEPLQALREKLRTMAARKEPIESVRSLGDAHRWLQRMGAPPENAHATWVRHALALGLYEDAFQAAYEWMEADPKDSEAARLWVHSAVAGGDSARLLQAQTTLCRQVSKRPAVARALLECAHHCKSMGLREHALAAALALVEALPDAADHHVALAQCLLEQQDAEAARPALDRALAIAPGHPGARLGWVLLHCLQSDFARALNEADRLVEETRAEEAQQDHLAALRLRALALSGLGRHDEAELCARECCALLPDAMHRLALGLHVLAGGDWAEGWRLWRQRDRLSEHAPHTREALRHGARLWTEPGIEGLRGRRLLVTSENGHGDTFQFGRFLPWLSQQGVEVTLLARPQAFAFLRDAAPGLEVLCEGSDAVRSARFDVVCDAQWLPAQLDVRPDDLQRFGNACWLRADPRREAQLNLPHRRPGRLRVGLAWRGQACGAVRRSMPLQALADARIENVDWVSLQIEVLEPSEILAAEQLGLTHERWGFADAAAAIAQLDLVVSVDTSLAHLAGALGVPCRVLLPQPADWRWGLHAKTTPWYPQIRLLRQSCPGDWSAPLALLRSELGAETRETLQRSATPSVDPHPR